MFFCFPSNFFVTSLKNIAHALYEEKHPCKAGPNVYMEKNVPPKWDPGIRKEGSLIGGMIYFHITDFDLRLTEALTLPGQFFSMQIPTKMNRSCSGKLQVSLLSACSLNCLKEIVLPHFQSLFGRSSRNEFWENEGKIHERGYV